MEHLKVVRSKMASLSTATNPVAATIPLSRYVIIAAVSVLCLALVGLILWGLWRLYRRKKRFGAKAKGREWIPFQFPSAMRPSVTRVQPQPGDSIFSDVKYQVRPPLSRLAARKNSVLPVPLHGPVGPSRQRRCSVPVLPAHLTTSANTAMDFTMRRYSAAFNDPRASLSSAASAATEVSEYDEKIDEKEDAARRASVSSGRRRSSVADPGSLDPNMYGFGPESALNAHGLGKLCFSLSYNAEIEVLYVRVNRATYLSAAKRAQENGNYYVELSLQPTSDGCETKRMKTNVVNSLRNPVFEHDFCFNCSQDDLNIKVIKFLIKEKKRQREILKGTVTFPLQDIQNRLDNPNLSSIWRDIAKDDCTDRTAGKVYVSLCYRPKRSQLQVGIIKCRDLTITEQESAVFCRITMMSAEKALKNEKSKSVKKDLDCPLINELFTFDIHQSLLNNICMSVTLWSRRSFGFHHLLGKAIIGPMTYCDGEGFAHWTTMVHDPDKTVHNWHTLEKQ